MHLIETVLLFSWTVCAIGFACLAIFAGGAVSETANIQQLEPVDLPFSEPSPDEWKQAA